LDVAIRCLRCAWWVLRIVVVVRVIDKQVFRLCGGKVRIARKEIMIELHRRSCIVTVKITIQIEVIPIVSTCVCCVVPKDFGLWHH
jgi:hypothetical protein